VSLPYPNQFQARYAEMLSEAEWNGFWEYMEKPLRKSIRINTLKISVPEFKKIAQRNNWQIIPIPWINEGFFIDREDRKNPLGHSSEHQAGLFYIQESISMLPGVILAPQKKEIVLDMAASPGSKTTHLAMMMENTGFILANDLSSKRIKGLISNLLRLNIANTAVVRKNGLVFAQKFPNTFDKILLDAPCTGEGLIRKDRTVLNKWSLANIKIMSGLQKKLIDSAFQSLRTGGEMVYSTCTLAPEENEEVIDFLVRKYDACLELVDLRAELKNISIPEADILRLQGLTEFEKHQFSPEMRKCLRIWPQVWDTEGFFIAKIKKLRKIGTSTRHNIFSQMFSNLKPIKILGRKERKRIESFVKKQFGYNLIISQNLEIIKNNHDLILRSPFSERFYQIMKFEFNGLSIFKEIREKLILSHEAVSLWGKMFTKQILEMNEQQKNDYLAGKDIMIEISENLQEGMIVLCYRGVVVGKGLLKGGKVKNQLPRGQVIG
jgi:16S rRNA (cytosine1407-C5)-methyltransferase